MDLKHGRVGRRAGCVLGLARVGAVVRQVQRPNRQHTGEVVDLDGFQNGGRGVRIGVPAPGDF